MLVISNTSISYTYSSSFPDQYKWDNSWDTHLMWQLFFFLLACSKIGVNDQCYFLANYETLSMTHSPKWTVYAWEYGRWRLPVLWLTSHSTGIERAGIALPSRAAGQVAVCPRRESLSWHAPRTTVEGTSKCKHHANTSTAVFQWRARRGHVPCGGFLSAHTVFMFARLCPCVTPPRCKAAWEELVPRSAPTEATQVSKWVSRNLVPAGTWRGRMG